MPPSKGQGSPPSASPHAAFFLVGPTAAGKSAVAQHIAEVQKWDILSADSMLVYRGMDIGTAKPSAGERARVACGGMDVASPDEPFSVGQYVECARRILNESSAKGKQLIVTGGTGLYIKCLTEGLARLPPPDPALRARAEALLERDGVVALQKVLRQRDSVRYEAVRDKNNPRRLIRALELAGQAVGDTKTWSSKPSVPMIGLEMDSELLMANIRNRIRGMYDSGLLDEVDRLLSSYQELSETALQAIGYAEAIAVRQGRMTLEDAMAKTAARTRQLAKRQMTWFRHQANVIWISVGKNCAIERIAERVLAQWKKYGPTPVII
jgi:tRNA dimethylallyltransferase